MKRMDYTTFSLRHFDENTKGTKIDLEDKDELLSCLNVELNKVWFKSDVGDFCIYVSIENTFGVKSVVSPISKIKDRWVRSEYVKRQEGELPVLTRFAEVPFWFNIKDARNIVAVLYSREQLLIEHEATQTKNGTNEPFELDDDVDYGIVALLGSEHILPDPMTPITMMRNALGVDEGGNGVKLDNTQYMESYLFWSENILVKKTNKLF